jgi:hypothetical protein
MHVHMCVTTITTRRREVDLERQRLAEQTAECERLTTLTDELKARLAEAPPSAARSARSSKYLSSPTSAKSDRLAAALGGASGGGGQHGGIMEELVMQLEEIRSSHARERLEKDKEYIKLRSTITAVTREKKALSDRMSLLQQELEKSQASVIFVEKELAKVQKEASEAHLRDKMAQTEIADLRRLLQQAQQASASYVCRCDTQILRPVIHMYEAYILMRVEYDTHVCMDMMCAST